jgi:Flp pilus assembly protein TadG
MSTNPQLPSRKIRRFLKRFRRSNEGAAAVEFALVAMPFIGLLIAVMELGIFYFASRYFEDGVFNASRQIMTQRLPAATICTAFKTEIANNFPTWLNPNNIVLTVKSGSSFGGTPTTVNFASGSCSFGSPGQVVTVTATYPYPFQGFRAMTGGVLWGANLNLSVSTAFRVEPS